MNLGFAGHFDVYKQKVKVGSNGEPMLDESGKQIPLGDAWLAADFNNLITDIGLNNLGTGNPLQYISLSSNTAEPTVNDSTMLEVIATKKLHLALGVSPGESNKSAPPYYVSCNYSVEFAAGEGTGNITKIGAGREADGSQLWSSALITNDGVNTAISKLPDEILKVIYNLRMYVNATDHIGTVDISGQVHNIVLRVADFNNWGSLPLANILYFNVSEVLNGDISNIYSKPAGARNDRVFSDNLPYVNNSNEKGCVFTLAVNEGNLENGIKSLLVRSEFNAIDQKYWQISFSPPIMKTSTMKLSFPPFYIQWGRYVAP